MKKSDPRYPDPPERLSDESQQLWRAIVRGFDLREDDAGQAVLSDALDSRDLMRKAQALLDKEGIVIKDRFGQDKPHPAVVIERDARAGFLRGVRQLGLDLEPLTRQVPPRIAR